MIVLDVSGVDFLDSAGVHALFRMLTSLQSQRKQLVIVAPKDGRVRRLIEILDLPSLASVCDTLEEALNSALKRGPDSGTSRESARLPIGRGGT